MFDVIYWYNDQSFSMSRSAIIRAVGQYARRNQYIYIGLTQRDPEKRFKEHQSKWEDGHKWDRMIVIYKARSHSLMSFVEDLLIKYCKEQIKKQKYLCEILNEIDSRKPRKIDEAHSYWVYILVQENYGKNKF